MPVPVLPNLEPELRELDKDLELVLLPPPTVAPPPPELRLLIALAISEALAYLIGMTSDTYSEGTEISISLSISSMRLTFSERSRITRIWLLSMANGGSGVLANGCRTGITS